VQSESHKFNRILSALDELVTQEMVTARAGDYAAVDEIQRRAAPLVETLSELGAEVADATAQARVAGLLARRQHNIDFIESQLATVRAELLAVQTSTGRVARIAPAYARAEGASLARRFSAAG
jgi:hypothetical protein